MMTNKICGAPLTDFVIDAGVCQRPPFHQGIHWFNDKADVPAQYSTLAGAAAAFAIRAHDGQVRTGTQFPYVVHPIGVAHILREFYPKDETLEAAGYLHDVIEDTEVTFVELELRFGHRVADLVLAVTRRPNWSLDRYAANKDVMRLKAADVIDNVIDTIRGLEKGHDVWSRFRAGRNKVDYWAHISTMVSASLKDEPIAERLYDLEAKVWWMARDDSDD